ncbi:MAG: flagellar motor switch protein FliN [Planctomycetota bacterium]
MSEEGNKVSQDDVDALLKQGSEPQQEGGAEPEQPAEPTDAGDKSITDDELDKVLAQATSQSASQGELEPPPEEARPFNFQNVKPADAKEQERNIQMLMDVDMSLRVELGRRKMNIEEILRLGQGAVVELDKLAGDPLDILVNDRLVAHGEVLVLNDNFCIRVTSIVPPEESRKA